MDISPNRTIFLMEVSGKVVKFEMNHGCFYNKGALKAETVLLFLITPLFFLVFFGQTAALQ